MQRDGKHVHCTVDNTLSQYKILSSFRQSPLIHTDDQERSKLQLQDRYRTVTAQQSFQPKHISAEPLQSARYASPLSSTSKGDRNSNQYSAMSCVKVGEDTYVVAGLAILPLLVSERHEASTLGSSTLLLLERLTRGTRADGRVLVEAVGISWFATCKRKPCRSIASQQHVDQRESMSKWAIGGPIKVK